MNHPFSSPKLALSPWTDAAVPPAGSITPTPVANVLADDPAVHSYQQAQRNAAPGTWSSGLHLGVEQVTWAAGIDTPEPAVRLCLPLGGAHTARQFFRGTIPTPLELENAIAAVEDEVHIAHRQLRGLLPPGQVWAPWSADVALHDLATLASVPPGPHRVLTLDAMERLFNRLVAVSEGRPAAQEGLPDDPAFAGTLLVLRELMHHLPFASLVLVDGTTGA
ncbi:hypothetical protein [Acidovorax sp. ST3]|uniref:hypothetical protein n=1 Tax=Acidovorax sp. ST3 TaxID=2219062 RepID=UPI001EF00AFC|nr:hypothetical protein [Acidovorax sp. ST3]